MKEKSSEASDNEAEEEESQPVEAGFFVVGDRVRRRREEFASDRGQIGRRA